MAVASLLPSSAVGRPRTNQGGLVTFDLGLAERLDIELDTEIHALEKYVPGAPILGFTSRLGAPRRSKQPVFYTLRTRPLRQYFDVVTGTTAAGATMTIAAADVSILKKGFHILNTRTREIIRISGTPATTLPIADRAVGTVSAAVIADGSEFLILGYRGAEGDEKAEDISYFPESIYNYIGEHQRTFKVSQYEDASSKRGEGTRRRLRGQHLQEARMVVEKGYLFDQRKKSIRSDDSKVVYTPNGFDAICSENETDFDGSVTEQKILAAAEDLARYGPGSRMVMCSPRFMRKVNEVFIGDRRINANTVTMAGVNVVRYQAGPLTLNFFQHPLFHDASDTDINSLKGTAFVADFQTLRPRTLGGSKGGYFAWTMNVETTKGSRYLEDQLVVNFGLEWRFAEVNGRWINPGS